MKELNPDPKAVSVAKQVHEMLRPLGTILLGSRARGDHLEDSSDIDIILVGNQLDVGPHQKRVEEKSSGNIQRNLWTDNKNPNAVDDTGGTGRG